MVDVIRGSEEGRAVGAPVRRSLGSRLTGEDWAQAALDVLMTQGVAAVEINGLCRHLGVTRGSFYWHFESLGALQSAMAQLWCEQTRTALSRLAELDRLPPAERLNAMTLRLVDDATWGVERALRDWGRTEPTVATTIAEADLFVFSLVESALLELRGDPREARVIAGVLVYAAIGFAHGPGGLPKPTAEEIRDLFALIG